MTGINLPKRNLRHVKKESDMSKKKKRNREYYELTDWDKEQGLKQICMFNIDNFVINKSANSWFSDKSGSNKIKLEGK